MMLQLLLAIAVILGSFEPFCTGQKFTIGGPGLWTKNPAAFGTAPPPAPVCPPECPPGFVARFIDTSNGGFYSCDQFSLGGSEGKEKHYLSILA